MKLRRHRFLLSVLLLALCFALSSCSAAGFVPKSDTTWGELFRHFDSEAFSELDPQLQQMMDEAVLSQEVAENEAQPLTEVGSVAPIYPEGLARTASLCDLEEDFTGLESGRTYTIKARAFVLPPEGRTIEGSLYTEAGLATL